MNPTAINSRRVAGATVFAALGLLIGSLQADLVVNTNLGPLAPGSTNLTGTTAGGPNNANNYTNVNPARFWGSEFVYQFSTSVRAVISITSNDPNGDPPGAIDNDFFLLDTLVTTPSGATNVGTAVGDFVEVSGTLTIVDPGTHYLTIDVYASLDSAGPGNAGAFSAVLTIALPPAPPPATHADPGGSINTNLAAGAVLWYKFDHPGGAFTVDTFGSTLAPYNDTELFLFAEAGTVVATNDDANEDPEPYLSRISVPDLPAETYYLAAGGFDTTGSAGFVVTSTSSEAGPLVINGLHTGGGPVDPPVSTPVVEGGSLTATLAAAQVQWYVFTHPGGPFTLDTIGSTLAPDNDTELFLYNAIGAVVAENDDITVGNRLSRISVTALPGGTYYLAVGGYPTVGGAAFGAVSTSDEAGQFVLNGLMLPPVAPSAKLAALSLAGDTLTLRLTGVAGRTYRIEKAESPGGPWTTDGADVTLTTPEQTFTRTAGPAETRLFHRATELP